MKAISSFGIFAALLLALIVILAMSNFNPSMESGQLAGSASLVQQATPTPGSGDASEIGSTDGILFMGIVIVLIVTLPLLFHKRNQK